MERKAQLKYTVFFHMKIGIGLNPLPANTLTPVTFLILSSYSLTHLLLVPGNVVLSRKM